MGRHRLLGNFLKKSSGNVSGELFQNLTTGGKNTGFREIVTDMKKGRSYV